MAKKQEEPTPLMLGPVEVLSGKETPSRLAILLWGAATCGKTTFAATAPGKKLWLAFGDNEHVSISHRDDVIVANLSNMPYDDLFKHAQSDNPFNLDRFLLENEDILTVVVDSTTAIEYKALQKAVGEGYGKGKDFKPTMESPGISAYGARNAILIEVMTGILRVTAKHNVHVIFTAHEGDPRIVAGTKDTIDYIAMNLTGKVTNGITWRLSEIWFMMQETTGTRARYLAIRPTRNRKPMKTRMFDLKGDPGFYLSYDADLADEAKGQMTIAQWHEAWLDNDKRRIALPKTGVKK